MPEAVEGVVPYINQFSKLWVGTVQPEFFKKTFFNLKCQVLNWIADLPSIQDNDNYRIGHKLDLCHQALQSQWHDPVTATVVDNDIFWESGQSRIIAGGLCWSTPWLQHRLLVLSQKKNILDHWLVDPVEISSDTELEQLLGTDTVNTISTRFDVDHLQRLSLRIGSISKNTPKKDSDRDLSQKVQNLREWVKSNPRGTQLDVYTDRPDLITDSIGYWNIRYPSTSNDTNYKFYVQDQNQPVDVAELLFWMDNEHTEFVSNDNKFILEKPSTYCKTKIVGLSKCNV